MAVAYDTAGGGQTTSNTNSISWSHTVGSSGATVVVLAGIATGDTSATQHSSWTRSCTYGAVSMTSLAGPNSGTDGSNNGGFEWFYLFNPLTGAQTVQATTTKGGGTMTSMIGCSLCFTGVASLGTPVSSNNTTGAPTVSVTSATGDMVAFGHCSGGTISTPTQTQRFLSNLNGSTSAGNLLLQTATGSGSIAGGAANNSDYWANIGVNLVASATSSAGSFFAFF